MAEKKSNQELKEESQYIESVVGRLKELLKLQGDEIKNEKNLLKLQEDRLKDSLENDELIKDEYDLKLKIIKAEEKILYSRNRGRIPQVASLKHYEEVNKKHNDFLKTQGKSVDLEKILDKLGFSRSAKLAGIVKSMGMEKALKSAMIAGTLVYLALLYKDFQQIDKAAAEFRKSIGITRADSEILEQIARDITFDFAQVGVNASDVYKSISAITSAIGSSQSATKEMVKDMTLLSVQLGVAESSSAEFLRVMGQMSKLTMSSQSNIALFTAKLSAAAGTNLNDVMGDVAAASKSSYQFLTREPLVLAKAAIEAKRMGTSLQSATATASSLLNFTQNVKDEMEASVLVGKSINLQKARELAYHRDIRGLNKEILNIINQTDFENLDPFQQDAVARALGKSSDELAKMAQADREMSAMRHSNDPSIKAQVAAYDKLVNANKKIADDEAKNYSLRLAELSNAESLKTITLAFHAITQKILQGPLKAIAGLFTGIGWTVNWINHFLGKGAGYLGLILNYLDDIFVVYLVKHPKIIMNILKGFNNLFFHPIKFIKDIGKGLSSVEGFLLKIGKLILRSNFGFKYISVFFRTLGPPINAIVKVFGRILVPLMFAYHIFQEIMNIIHDPTFKGGFWESIWRGIQAVFKALWTTINDLFFGLPQMIANGLEPIGQGIFDAIIDGFNKAWHWVSKLWGGHSPSEVGLSILEGIVAVEGLILKSLISPFIKAWEFIKKLPLISKLFGGGVANTITPEAKPAMTVEKSKMGVDAKKSSDNISDTVNSMSDELAKRMSSIVDAINALRDDMKSGALTANVYIDSQKLDALMGRRLAYTGQLT